MGHGQAVPGFFQFKFWRLAVAREGLDDDHPATAAWTGGRGVVGTVTSASAGSRWGFGPASSSRARAMLSAQEALANRHRISGSSVMARYDPPLFENGLDPDPLDRGASLTARTSSSSGVWSLLDIEELDQQPHLGWQ